MFVGIWIFTMTQFFQGIFTKLSKLVKAEDGASASASGTSVATAGSDSGISGTSSPPIRAKSPPVLAPRKVSTSSDDKTPAKPTGNNVALDTLVFACWLLREFHWHWRYKIYNLFPPQA